MQKSELIKQKANEIGFDIFGITSPEISGRDKNFYREWINRKYNGAMKWMDNSKRLDITEIMPDVKSVITLGINYYNADNKLKINSGRIAKYARGTDYHEIFWSKLKLLCEFIEQNIPNSTTKYYADTGPILERSYAAKAEIGFIGKNTCLINERFGSWILISEILVNVELKNITQKRFSKSNYLGCGSCTRCINACPTGALEAPYKLNANKCISYLTIENKEGIPVELRTKIGDKLFGCDICQNVCPWNISRQQKATLNELTDRPIAGESHMLKEILSIKSDDEFKARFKDSPVLRVNRRGLIRNACVVAGNIGDESLIPYLENLNDEDEMIREHAAWAISEIKKRRMIS